MAWWSPVAELAVVAELVLAVVAVVVREAAVAMVAELVLAVVAVVGMVAALVGVVAAHRRPQLGRGGDAGRRARRDGRRAQGRGPQLGAHNGKR